MAISTNTILDSITWAKRFNFNRPLNVGNSLQPALTSANLVAQAILSPPFKWWWNNEEFAFTCASTPASAGLTGNVSVTGGVLTATVAVPAIGPQQVALLSGFSVTAAEILNGQAVVVLTNNGTTITAQIDTPNLASTAATGGTITAGTTQDYTLALPEFSHIEHASVLDISRTPNKWIELAVKGNLSLDSGLARPQFIEPHVEDAEGNVAFRVMPSPNLNYPVSLHIQKTAPIITSLNQTWAPIPDFMEYIYNWGFLAAMWSFTDDPRAQTAHAKFVTHLLGRATGLTAIERNIFLNNWTDLTELEKLTVQQGVQARGQ